ncbi:hypothetical protein [Paraburkholderia unamae]|uniref:Uncharacterized protein n=2 Tax=Paraburkholderia TaxID=1822464 RepID=A0ACC6RM90_9BURK
MVVDWCFAFKEKDMDFFPENVLRAGLVLCILYAGSARADLSKTVLDSARPDDVLTGKIFYAGAVTLQKTNDLVSALDELNVKYPRLKSIYLYIDSRGGKMSVAQIAYRAIQS